MKKLFSVLCVLGLGTSMFAQSPVSFRQPKAEPTQIQSSETQKVYLPVTSQFIEISDLESEKPVISSRANTDDGNPNAHYALPDGFFYTGLDERYSAFDEQMPTAHGPAYAPSQWKNHSKNALSYNWTLYLTPDSDTPSYTSEENPIVSYLPGVNYFPILDASLGPIKDTYGWPGVLLTGGRATRPPYDYGSTNVDFKVYDYTLWRPSNDPGGCVFGTNSTIPIESVCEFFAKPPTPYILDYIRFSLGAFSAPAGTEFQVVIHKMEQQENNVTRELEWIPTDTLAKMICTDADVVSIDEARDEGIVTNYSMVFNKGFRVLNTMGFEVTVPQIIVEDAIMVELTGFRSPDVRLGVFSQHKESPDRKSTAYFYAMTKDGERKLYPSTTAGVNMATSLLVNMGITYTYLYAPEKTVDLNASGSAVSKEIFSYYALYEMIGEQRVDNLEINELPEWLSYDLSFSESTWEGSISFTAEPLPSGVTERQAVVKAEMLDFFIEFTVTQAGETSIDIQTVSSLNASYNENAFELTYTSDYNAVSIYTAAGQHVGSYKLPESGQAQIPVTVASGVYFVNFSGLKNVTKKVLVY